MDAEQLKAVRTYSREYRGYLIHVMPQDSFSQFFLIEGLPCAWGYGVSKGGCNPIPGAGWFRTVEDAHLGIECLIEAGDDAQRFHDLYRAARLAMQHGPELLSSLERLSFAAMCRDNTTGDPCRLIEVKAELAAANKQAIAVIAKATGIKS